jgi:hypothetical protein
VYYTARPDGDGYAESEVSDVGETDTINRTLYYSDKFEADPDTAGDWTQYTTQPADNATFATAKAALLAGLNDTDATAETRGTLPLSLKMVRTTSAAATDLLLDTYTGASAAYSVRKLDKDYTGYCMKVREDSGDTEADIGFDGSGDLDTAAIATHCGSANGYVVTWYDQSGNSDNATQATGTSQPQIYNGTAVITENGKPALVKQGTAGAFDGPTFSGTVLTVFGVSVVGATTSRLFQMSGFFMDGAKIFQGSSLSFSSTDLSNQALYSLLFDATDQAFLNGSSVANGDAGTNSAGAIVIGGQNANQRVVNSMQEIIFYENNTHAGSSPRSGIETDVNTYFSIYT